MNAKSYTWFNLKDTCRKGLLPYLANSLFTNSGYKPS
jgi:hypothetical protein